MISSQRDHGGCEYSSFNLAVELQLCLHWSSYLMYRLLLANTRKINIYSLLLSRILNGRKTTPPATTKDHLAENEEMNVDTE